MLVQIGREGLRMAAVLPKLRERLKAQLPAEPTLELAPSERVREGETGANVAGMAGMLARPGNCCNPLPGDELLGFITRGRGVVIHRTDCPNLRHLIEREPERQVPVEWPALDGKQVLRAQIVIEGNDRTGLLRDITYVIANSKINMVQVETTTKARPHEATITATLELQRPEQLGEILAELRAVRSVTLAERLVPGRRKGAGGDVAAAASGTQPGANGHSAATGATHSAARNGKTKHDGKAGHTGHAGKAGRKG
jgi:GTP pyrophosphokinase